jgi:uncharacterized RDD family membrane protein YckC
VSVERDIEADATFAESLSTLSLTELQDVFGHLDRDRYPDRIEAIRAQMENRIEALSTADFSDSNEAIAAGVLRRLWGSLLDIFVSLFPVVMYLGAKMLAASSGGGREGRGGRGAGQGGGQPEETFVDQIIAYITSPEAIWETVETYGPWVLGFMVYRALYAIPQLARSGVLPGMREAGLRVQCAQGERLGFKQAGLRFISAYILGILTLGISHLWAIWDGDGRTLFDRLTGTCVVRLPRRWEKPTEQRLLEE